MDSQPEFFEELPQSVNPSSDFIQARVDKNKIISIPISFWKGGRMRAVYGREEFVSRNKGNLKERIIQALQHEFNTAIVEIVSEEFAREQASRPPIGRSRVRKKDIGLDGAADLVYANPFQDRSNNFGKGPDWLLQRRDLRPIEKLIYARLLFPLPPICEQWDQELGVIIELDQAELAKSLGINRSTVNKWLVSLQLKGWIVCNGNPGAKQTVRFLWKEGMPETCRHVPTGLGQKLSQMPTAPVGHPNSNLLARVTEPVGPCEQVSEGIEKRELRENKEEREKRASSTSVPSLGGGPLADALSSFSSSLSSPKAEKQEPAWFDEIRGMYPGTNVTGDLKRIEKGARKKKKPFTRELALNALRRHPPKKPGQREAYLYKGKVIEKKKANALAAEDRDLLLNAKPVILHADGHYEMVLTR